mgnify:CR=1 FL=1
MELTMSPRSLWMADFPTRLSTAGSKNLSGVQPPRVVVATDPTFALFSMISSQDLLRELSLITIGYIVNSSCNHQWHVS